MAGIARDAGLSSRWRRPPRVTHPPSGTAGVMQPSQALTNPARQGPVILRRSGRAIAGVSGQAASRSKV
jgi:hypothetical protein